MNTSTTNLRLDRARYDTANKSFSVYEDNGDVDGMSLEDILPADFRATATGSPDGRTRVAKITFYVKVEYE